MGGARSKNASGDSQWKEDEGFDAREGRYRLTVATAVEWELVPTCPIIRLIRSLVWKRSMKQSRLAFAADRDTTGPAAYRIRNTGFGKRDTREKTEKSKSSPRTFHGAHRFRRWPNYSSILHSRK